jgi:uncharacterized protein YxeA
MHRDGVLRKPEEVILARASKGISLIELLIIVVMISVVATAFWNLRIGRSENPLAQSPKAGADGTIRSALDEIASNLRFASYNSLGRKEALTVDRRGNSEVIRIVQNDVILEYFVDDQGNLIRRVGSLETILGENIASLKLLKMGKETVIITISVKDDSIDNADDGADLSRSFSTVIRMNQAS